MYDQRTKHQAQHRVQYTVRKGRLPHPSTLPCADCGAPAREYDHHLGYAPEHWLDVQAVCRSCHCKRGVARGEANTHLITGRPRKTFACLICGRGARRYSLGRCDRCYTYWRRHGMEWSTRPDPSTP